MSAVSLRGWLGLMAWGVLFAIGSLLYGVAIDLLGIALGFAVQLGLSSVLGALLPLLWTRAISLRNTKDALFLGGLAVMVAGDPVRASGRREGRACSRTSRKFSQGPLHRFNRRNPCACAQFRDSVRNEPLEARHGRLNGRLSCRSLS